MANQARIESVNVLPSWYPGAENKPAPMPLLLVQGLVNTRDVEDGTDLLADPAAARKWLLDAGLVDDGGAVTDSDLETVRRVREAIRSLIELEGATKGPDELHLEPLRGLAEAHRARLGFTDDGTVTLASASHGEAGDGLFELLLIIRAAQLDGSWSRLKLCANPDCRWAFYDRSRNHQGSWCSMASCGNRIKNRELRARRR